MVHMQNCIIYFIQFTFGELLKCMDVNSHLFLGSYSVIILTSNI